LLAPPLLLAALLLALLLAALLRALLLPAAAVPLHCAADAALLLWFSTVQGVGMHGQEVLLSTGYQQPGV
jgi:hypothetical protein